MADIQGVILFCDDVREEKSGKSTLVGVYANDFLLDPSQKGAVAQVVASLNARIKGTETVHLKITVEARGHSQSNGPNISEHDFAMPQEATRDEWMLRVNVTIPIIFEVGPVISVIMENEDFRAEGSLRLRAAPTPGASPQ